jgi:hypothetical protein
MLIRFIDKILLLAFLALAAWLIFDAAPHRNALQIRWRIRRWIGLRRLELQMRLLEFRIGLGKLLMFCHQRSYLSSNKRNLAAYFGLARATVNHPIQVINMFKDASHDARNRKTANLSSNRISIDPTLSQTNAPIVSAELRDQLNGLKDLIDALVTSGVRAVLWMNCHAKRLECGTPVPLSALTPANRKARMCRVRELKAALPRRTPKRCAQFGCGRP